MNIGHNARASIVHFSHQISYKDREKMSSLMHVVAAGVTAVVAAGVAAAHTHTQSQVEQHDGLGLQTDHLAKSIE
jgi:hypothetical protein